MTVSRIEPPAGIDRPITILKFGGTSVATEEGRHSIAERVAGAVGEGKACVVVVSAIGRRGAPYATDTLLGLVEKLPADAYERDLLASVGEVISAVLVAHELRAAGLAAKAFTGADAGILTDGVAGQASITEIHTGPLASALADGLVPVVCGFQGADERGRVTTLGRGGSDTTACAIGVALGADEVEIYTDVDGVMTADPRTCDGTRVIEVIGADELFQLARHGGRVVHTPAAELALASGLALRVRNTYSEHPGTTVARVGDYRPSSVATAVTSHTGITRLHIHLGKDESDPDYMRAQSTVYRALADAAISLDMFTPIGGALVCAVASELTEDAQAVLAAAGFDCDTSGGLAKVTLVGAGMHGVAGVMARMAELLADAGVTVIQTADSHTTISVLLREDEVSTAVRALHDGFSLAATV